jgi:D-aspartate ligase
MKIEPRQIGDNSVPVVVLVSSQHGGIGAIRSLGMEGIPVYGVHESRWEPAARSRYLRDVFCWNFSAATAPHSVRFLQQTAEKLGKRPILIATSDITASFVAENAGALTETYRFASPPVEAVRAFNSKRNMFELCRRLNVPTANTIAPQSRGEALSFADATTFPIIVKGEDGEFLRAKNETARVAIVAGKQDLLQIFELNAADGPPRVILQEFIPGGDDAIWMFNGYFNERSECLFGATGRKLRQFPPHRGSTSLGVTQRNEAVEDHTLRLMRAVGYRGPLDLGFRFDARDGQYKLLDVNPRIGATFRLFVAENGMDVARALYMDLTGQNIPASHVNEGRKWIVESNDLISSWSAFREGQLTPVGWWRSLGGVREGAWLAGDDLAPLAALPMLWARKKIRRSSVGASSESMAGSPAKRSTA